MKLDEALPCAAAIRSVWGAMEKNFALSDEAKGRRPSVPAAHESTDTRRERLRLRLTTARQGDCNWGVNAGRAIALGEGGWAESLLPSPDYGKPTSLVH